MEFDLVEASKNALVRKPVGTTHFKNTYTAAERKLLNGCLWYAHENGLNKPLHRMPIEIVRAVTGASETRNFEWLRRLSAGLVSSLVEWNSLGKDKTIEWNHCTALSSGRLRNGGFEFRVNPELLEQLKDPRLWGQFRLLAQIGISSKHTLAIFEFLSTEMSLARVKDQELIILVPLADIREVCGLNEGQYAAYKDFNKHVLQPSVKEMTKETDLSVKATGKRVGRKVANIEFVVQKKSNFQYSLPGFDAIGSRRVEKNQSETDDALIIMMKSIGISELQSKRLAKKYSADRIEKNIEYAKERRDSGKIKNYPAYIVKAIEQNFNPGKTVEEEVELERLQDASEERKKQAVRDEEIKALEREFHSFRYQRAREIYENRSKSWKYKKRKEFESSLPENDFIIRKPLQNGEWNNPIVETPFFGYLVRSVLSEPHELDFEAFRKWREKAA